MTRGKAILLAALAAFIVTAMLFGQVSPRLPVASEAHDWEMISVRVAAGAAGGSWPGGGERMAGEMFLYNKRTGKVYLRFFNCTSNGRELDGGCFAPVAVFANDADVIVTPTPTNYGSGQNY